MDQKLIQFAKVHGYLCAALTMCSGIAFMALRGSSLSSASGQSSPLYLILSIVNAFLILIGTLSEDSRWIKPAKRVYIVCLFGGSMMLIFGQAVDSSFPIIAAFVILPMSLYGFLLLRFLDRLFADLERRKRQTIVTITAIVCESQPAAPEQSRPVLPAEEQQNQAVPPSYEETVASRSDETGKPKEFPTWT